MAGALVEPGKKQVYPLQGCNIFFGHLQGALVRPGWVAPGTKDVQNFVLAFGRVDHHEEDS
jgi:hypothetical protein